MIWAYRVSFLVGFFTLLLPTKEAWAYVDPGVLSILYQALYAAVFGFVTLWIVRPWRYLKSMLDRLRGLKSRQGNSSDGER